MKIEKAIIGLLYLTIVLLFNEQYNFSFLLEKGIYMYHLTAISAIALFFVQNIRKIQTQSLIESKWYFVFLFFLGLSCLFSQDIKVSVAYFSVLLLNVLFYFVLVQYREYVNLDTLVKVIVLSLLIAIAVSVYDYIALRAEWITFNKSPSYQTLQSGFSYFANTAIFSQTFLAVLIPYSIVGNKAGKCWNRIYLIVNLLSVAFLISTGRVSSIVTFFFSLLISLMIVKSNKVALKYFFCFIVGLTVFFLVAPELMYSFYNRFYTRIIERDPATLEGGFFMQNIENSVYYISHNFLFGAGLGIPTFKMGDYTFVLHGTYFKLFAETGFFSIAAYLFIMCEKVRTMLVGKEFVFVVFFIGILLSSVYNDFYARLEFWIYLAVLSLIFNKKICC